jgi:hypothetical protein
MIADLAGHAELPDMSYRGLSVRIAVTLARHYDRDTLDPTRLWDRVDTALQLAGGGLISGAEMLSAMLEHVKASAARVARDAECRELTGELADIDDAALSGLSRYLQTCRMAVVVFAREAWEAEKRKRCGRLSLEDEAAARERGQRPSKWFDEQQVQELMQMRAAERRERGEK